MSDTNAPRVTTNAVRFSVRYKLIIAFLVVFSVLFAMAFGWFWQYSTDSGMGRINADLLNTLEGTLRGIDGDEFEAMVKQAQPDDSGVPTDDTRYQTHQNWLTYVFWIQPKAYSTYTYVPGAGVDEILWVGDTYRVTDPGSATKWLEPYTRTPDSLILDGFKENTVNMTIYEDPWGAHVSAYGPIKNSQGQIVGAVGIDFEASEVLIVQREINRIMQLTGVVAYILLFLIVYAATGILTRPIVQLTNSAQRVGEGDYEQDFSSLTKDRYPDEIDVLAKNFAIMVDKVYQREQKLRRQVEELKIEIDEAKRSKQVSEIVDTDFFRDLQSKADRMRLRRSAAADSEQQAAGE